MGPWTSDFQGRFERRVLTSSALEDNPLGDPAERPVWVYLPPGAEDGTRRYPAIYVLQGFTHNVEDWWNRSAFRATVPELVDDCFGDGEVPPAIVVFVDAWTRLGGSQFINSPGTGRYLDYLCDDLIPFVDATFPTVPEARYRGIAGHSSGGYGALVVPMLRPGVFSALVSHSGDSQFEYCYMPDIAAAGRALRYEYEGSYTAFWESFRSRPAFLRGSDHALLNVYAMAACYSAQPDGEPVLPFEPASGRIREAVWEQWLAMDPVRMIAGHAETLQSLRGIYLDAGKRDEAYLDLGMLAVAAELDAAGIDHYLELFEGGHTRIEYRYPVGWRFLAERIAAR